jgi:hypothetical protein
VDATLRILAVLALVAYSVYRIVRLFRLGMTKRVSPGLPASAMVLTPQPPAAPNPIVDAPTLGTTSWVNRVVSRVLGAILWLGSNIILGLVLFAWPPMNNLPLLWRLIALVLVNFYLIPVARSVSIKHRIQGPPPEGPFSN